VREYTEALRRLCAEDHGEEAPYLLRTRFERNLYGLLVSFSESAFGRKPTGITEDHVRECAARCETRYDERELTAALSMAKLFGKFVYLCDTSNWSNDGQDPRLEMCRENIMQLCDLVESLEA